ncbi:putative virulence factor [Dinoroseobacter shibae DFL 12 = DSM 16493]|uniref:Probable lipid II flippase MurJ n=1 Tax=Dinoroseobacter shibae (strain DSM 16493 / NCIMB 14021 / DFL 12) TaxID=398580 RepID=A8LJ72_DINSH|nr:murein biosynthesis integral membrane protein MurJ [Dinoroseobacter shibae]ABV94567.1 putative virulence factor [Dinoroseobacter shibae DFL 12 = DSM 16493]URF45993.1 murein biosynthesis integral membrane protein MurJ [Dinoroseobacter shibae]URF50299.1 murein biosynthesis integral membrane protein MurJ [Dinoroseobacter shibae]
MKPIRLLAGFMTVGLWTMGSRVLGFVRDILIAGLLGAGPVADAFFVAFSLPNMFRRFFAEGAFNMAFVPMFSKRVQSGDDPEGFARDALSGLGLILILFTLVALAAMPWLVLAMASGFVGDARFDLAVGFGRIVFVYILFISLAALLSGVLNATGRFAAAAAAPILLNVILITALLVAETGVLEEVLILGGIGAFELGEIAGLHHGTMLAIGVVLAGIAQLWLLWRAAAKAGFPLRPRRPRMTPELKRLAIIAAPAALAGGVVQVNLLVGRQVASFFDGAIAWLNYADRLYQLPLGVVGIAIGIVLLPDLSRRLQAGDTAGGQDAFNRAGEICLALTVPAAVALLCIPEALVSVLFERGRFTAEDSAATALAVAVYGVGLPAFVLQKVFQPLFFAREDTRSPLRYALWAMVVNAGIAIGLAPVIGYVAAALGASLAGWAMVWLLWRGSRPLGEAAAFDARFKARIGRIVLAALAMGAVLLGAQELLSEALRTPTLRYGALAALVALGIVSYGAAGHLLGAFRMAEVKRALRRGP